MPKTRPTQIAAVILKYYYFCFGFYNVFDFNRKISLGN